jgi:glucokinase
VILAGDIGGTHARLALFDIQQGRLCVHGESMYPSKESRGLDEIVAKFVAEQGPRPTAACFGVAGPVRNGRVETSNLPWVVESATLAKELGLESVLLINDLEANAWGIGALDGEHIVQLNQVKGHPTGNQAVISAGTGLGEAGLYWDGKRYHVFASEGGHCDFAPRNELETRLLHSLVARFGHVSYERVLSGPGLVNIFHFLRESGSGHPPAWLMEDMIKGDPAAAISRAAMDGTCPLSVQALDLMISIYGAEAGNLALKVMSTGGMYIGGGIAPKILPKLSGPLFMQAFLSKGRMQPLLETIPVKVITFEKTALYGAARFVAVQMGNMA